MSAPDSAMEAHERAAARRDAETLAAWCARSSAGYNQGAWQAALLLGGKDFRRRVAEELAAMGLPDDSPAMQEWSHELARPAEHRLEGSVCSCGGWEAALGESIHRGFDRHVLESRNRESGP